MKKQNHVFKVKRLLQRRDKQQDVYQVWSEDNKIWIDRVKTESEARAIVDLFDRFQTLSNGPRVLYGFGKLVKSTPVK